MQKSILKGAIIFGVLGFVIFISILALGFVMSMIGVTSESFSIFRWSLIGVTIATGLVFWFGCCCKSGNEDCTKIKGYKE